jgi:hypothetical protein
MVKFASVVSGNIMAIGWEKSNAQLFVKFRAGPMSIYSGVPEKTYDAFLKAPSKGKFFAQFIEGQYPETKK